MINSSPDVKILLTRIAEALERLAPPPQPPTNLTDADAFLWRADGGWLEPVPVVNRVDIGLLRGIDRQIVTLLDNTRRFAHGLPANNALLWGARGTGKSSLVKAAHAAVNAETRPSAGPLLLIEIHREDIPTLPRLLSILAACGRRCLLFCDDLTFATEDESYKSLKAMLEGGIQGRPDNVLIYATSNRRHMMPRDMSENESQTSTNQSINPGEAAEEKVSLSDRFGLWLGFHTLDQATFFEIVEGYAHAYNLAIRGDQLRAEANEWAMTRGSRSGRVAWQFIQDIAGRHPAITASNHVYTEATQSCQREFPGCNTGS